MSPMPQPNGQNNEHLMVWNKQGSGIEKRYSCVNWHAKKITNTAKVYISFFKKKYKDINKTSDTQVWKKSSDK